MEILKFFLTPLHSNSSAHKYVMYLICPEHKYSPNIDIAKMKKKKEKEIKSVWISIKDISKVSMFHNKNVILRVSRDMKSLRTVLAFNE